MKMDEEANDDYLLMEIEDHAVDPSYSKKRLKRLNRMEKDAPLPKRSETERRNEGLSTELDESNKGFRMLQKMGYVKPKENLQKPIQITLKSDKKGLGNSVKPPVISSTKNVKLTQIQIKQREAEFKLKKSSFMNSKSLAFYLRSVSTDLKKCRSTCQDLDEKSHCSRNIFWPVDMHRVEEETVDEVDNDQEFEHLEEYVQLLAVNEYLRSQYFYCVWCGMNYDDFDLLSSQCPGETREDHDDC
jgi:hypothetical protein